MMTCGNVSCGVAISNDFKILIIRIVGCTFVLVDPLVCMLILEVALRVFVAVVVVA